MATAKDYEAAYKLFKANSSRSAVNVGDTHRKILDAVYELTNENPFEDSAFGVRKIAEKAGISPGTVTKNRAFLTKSLGFLWEPEDEKGLALVPGVGPEDWAGGNALEGFPLPFEVRKWQEGTPPSPEPGNSGNTETEEENPHTYTENPVSTPGNNRETQETVSGENGGRDASLTSEEAELFEHFLAKGLSRRRLERWL